MAILWICCAVHQIKLNFVILELLLRLRLAFGLVLGLELGFGCLYHRTGMGRMPILQTTGKTGMGNLRNRPRNRQLPDRISSSLIVILLYKCYVMTHTNFYFYFSHYFYRITGSIARSAKRQYLSHSNADLEVFHRAGAMCSTDGGEIWHG